MGVRQAALAKGITLLFETLMAILRSLGHLLRSLRKVYKYLMSSADLRDVVIMVVSSVYNDIAVAGRHRHVGKIQTEEN
jgi:hypothetical protein